MSGRFVRASKYRHVFGQTTRRDQCYDNLRISKNAWDTNLVKANPKYLSVNWEASGGGAFAVVPLEERGKLPEQIPLFRGHTGPVLDTDWSPFNDDIVASGSDDGKVFLWKVPEGFSLRTDADEVEDVKPVGKLSGHSRKVGHVTFNPAAENIIASSSGDYTIKLWDLEDGQAKLTLKHGDIVQSMSWSSDGSMLVTTCRDKKLRFWDVRQQKAVHEIPSHTGAKNSRCVWLGDHDRVATTGFSKMSDRQLGLWDVRNPTKPVGGDFTYLDSISGVCMPFWDDGTQMLYLAGKGDGNIRYYEYENDTFQPLSEHKSPEPQRGIGFMPKRGVNTHANEIMRAYKTVNDQYIEPISFIVPRRAEVFQDDIYPPAVGSRPAMSSSEWLTGKTATPMKISLEDLYEGQPPTEIKPEDAAKPTAGRTDTAPPPTTSTTTPKPEPKAESPAPTTTTTPAASREMPSLKDNKQSMSAMASKFADNDNNTNDDDAASDDDDASSFEEIPKPIERPQSIQVAKKMEEKVGLSSPPKAQDQTPTPTSSAPAAEPSRPSVSAESTNQVSPPPAATSTSAARQADEDKPTPSTTTASGAAGGLKEVLGEIRGMLQSQGRQIELLTREVAELRTRAG